MLKSIKNVEIVNKKVLLRLDLNVPIHNEHIQSDFRIKKSIPTILHLIKNSNSIIILSHLGRPNEGKITPELSLLKIAKYLSSELSLNIKFVEDWVNGLETNNNEIVMCENVRFQKGERNNDTVLSKKIASLGDIFVFDAFGASHRKEASTYGVMNYIDSYAGLLIDEEINNANGIINNPKKPLLTIISGAKISTKIKVISKLIDKCDYMILGGGILNTFLHALGHEIGKSLAEKEFVSDAIKIIESPQFEKIILPIDVLCSEIDNPNQSKNKSLSMVQSTDSIFDIGKQTINKYKAIIESSKTIFWNGPLGYIEKEPFDTGTIEILKNIASSDAYSIIGGGDTIPIVEKLGLQDNITCLSTGGGALLKYMEGEQLPVLKKLEK
tara:strand:- start:14108 stop:15259 length:1152 start_codon:yes stop_codon:yes gene_type:complete